MTDEIEVAVRTEIEALHEFFVGWFSGRLAVEELDGAFVARCDPDLLLVPPGGRMQTLAELAEGLRRAHGSNPDFRIAIRNVRVRRVLDGRVLATYEEWQRNALASEPADNARLATVLLELGEPIRWLHLHETWLPTDVMAAGPYDF